MTERPPRIFDSLPLTAVKRSPDGRLFAPAVQRNADPIGDVISSLLFPAAVILEIGSGTGEHLALFAARFPEAVWQPTEINEERLRSIEAWRVHVGTTNLKSPVVLDAASDWPLNGCLFDLVLAINLLQMLPGDLIEGMLGRARGAMALGGYLLLYSPWRDGDDYFSNGNRSFDETLRRSHPSLALPDISEVCVQAHRQGLRLLRRVTMPSSNHLLVFETEEVTRQNWTRR